MRERPAGQVKCKDFSSRTSVLSLSYSNGIGQEFLVTKEKNSLKKLLLFYSEKKYNKCSILQNLKNQFQIWFYTSQLIQST